MTTSKKMWVVDSDDEDPILVFSKLQHCLLYIKNPTTDFIEEIKKKVHQPWFNLRIIFDLPAKDDKLMINKMGIKLAKEVEIKPLKLSQKKDYLLSQFMLIGMQHSVKPISDNDDIFVNFDIKTLQAIGS